MRKTQTLVNTWCLRSPIELVYDVLVDVALWPEWWEPVQLVAVIEPAGPTAVGLVTEQVWKSRAPYGVTFTSRVIETRRPYEIRGTTSGRITGEGHWRLFENDGVTAVIYEWNVERRMSYVGGSAAWALRRDHRAAMRAGAKGLAERLGCELLVNA